MDKQVAGKHQLSTADLTSLFLSTDDLSMEQIDWLELTSAVHKDSKTANMRASVMAYKENDLLQNAELSPRQKFSSFIVPTDVQLSQLTVSDAFYSFNYLLQLWKTYCPKDGIIRHVYSPFRYVPPKVPSNETNKPEKYTPKPAKGVSLFKKAANMTILANKLTINVKKQEPEEKAEEYFGSENCLVWF